MIESLTISKQCLTIKRGKQYHQDNKELFEKVFSLASEYTLHYFIVGQIELIISDDVMLSDVIVFDWSYVVPDRDCGVPNVIGTSHMINLTMLRGYGVQDGVEREIRDTINFIVTHEVAEALHRNGVRLKDPHK